MNSIVSLSGARNRAHLVASSVLASAALASVVACGSAVDPTQLTGAGGNDGRGGVTSTSGDAGPGAPPPQGAPVDFGTPTVSDGGRGPTCQTVQAIAKPERADILIALDRSGSMDGERWTVATTAVSGAVKARETNARFGITLFPGVDQEMTCAGSPISVTPTELASSAIDAVVFADKAKAVYDRGYTPTRVTLERALESFTQAKAQGSKATGYVLLVTDGAPNCPAVGAKGDPDTVATYAALDALLAAGVKTFVVGYLTDGVKDVMDTMASHGGTGKHYAVKDAAALIEAISGVTSVVAPCSFELDAAPPSDAYVRVLVDGAEVALDASAGFSLDADSNKRVVFNGGACEKLRDGNEHNVAITVECEVVHPR